MIILCAMFIVFLCYTTWQGCQTLESLEVGEMPSPVFSVAYSTVMVICLVGIMFTSPYATWPLLAALPMTVGFGAILASTVWIGLKLQSASGHEPFPARDFVIYLAVFSAGLGICWSASLI